VRVSTRRMADPISRPSRAGTRTSRSTFTRLAHELGRDADAAAALERVAASHPADGELERIIGFVYRDGLGRAEEAEKHFTRARTLEGS